MISLVQECQLVIIKMLLPEEIKNLFESCDQFKQMIIQLNTHFPLHIRSKGYIKNDVINWFVSNHISLSYYKFRHHSDTHSDSGFYYYKNGLLHRDNDLPAFESFLGEQEWYQNGKRHRDNDLPAVTRYDGLKMWFHHGKQWRKNGLPTAICPYEPYFVAKRSNIVIDEDLYINCSNSIVCHKNTW